MKDLERIVAAIQEFLLHEKEKILERGIRIVPVLRFRFLVQIEAKPDVDACFSLAPHGDHDSVLVFQFVRRKTLEQSAGVVEVHPAAKGAGNLSALGDVEIKKFSEERIRHRHIRLVEIKSALPERPVGMPQCHMVLLFRCQRRQGAEEKRLLIIREWKEALLVVQAHLRKQRRESFRDTSLKRRPFPAFHKQRLRVHLHVQDPFFHQTAVPLKVLREGCFLLPVRLHRILDDRPRLDERNFLHRHPMLFRLPHKARKFPFSHALQSTEKHDGPLRLKQIHQKRKDLYLSALQLPQHKELLLYSNHVQIGCVGFVEHILLNRLREPGFRLDALPLQRV